MSAITLFVSKQGRAALTNAEKNGTAPIKIAAIGVTASSFVASDTTTTIPGEIKRLTTISGGATAADTLHVTIRDDSADNYSIRGFCLYLEDGTLFASYSQATDIMQKSSQATMLLAVDTQFTDIKATSLTFGDTNFQLNAATTEKQGVLELATADETITGADGTRGVTPAGLLAALNARFGAGAPSTFVKTLLTAATAAAFRMLLSIKSAALFDSGAGNGLDADKLDGQEGDWYRDWGNLKNVPTTASRWPAVAEVTGLQGVLDGKQPSGSYVTGGSGDTVPDNKLLSDVAAVGFWSKGTTPLPADAPVNNAFKMLNIGPSTWNSHLAFDAYTAQMWVRSRTASGAAFGQWYRLWTEANFTPSSKLDATATAAAATKLAVTRAFNLAGVVTAAAVNFDGTGNVTLTTAIADGALSIAKTSGLQGTLDGKLPSNGNAVSATTAASVTVIDTRNAVESPGDLTDYRATFAFKYVANVGNPPVAVGKGYAHILTVNGWKSDGTGGWPTQISFGDGLAVRAGTGATTWGAWRTVWHDGNFSPASTQAAAQTYADNRFTVQGTGGVLDWNDASNIKAGAGATLLRGTDSVNGPTPLQSGVYYYPFNIRYGVTGTQVFQFALPYGNSLAASAGPFIRTAYAGSFSPWSKMWCSHNHGAGSGLDADLLQGVNGSNYTRADLTNLGKTGNVAGDATTNTAALWSALPIGYARLMNGVAIGTAGGVPEATTGYFLKVGNRDMSGGWAGLWTQMTAANNSYIGFTSDASTLPTWTKLWTDKNFNPASKLDATATASAATKLAATRAFNLTGVVTAAAVNFDGTGNVTLTTVIADGALTIAKTAGLQGVLDGKANLSGAGFLGDVSAPQLVGTAANFMRSVFGGRGVIFRNDGDSLYLMKTAANDASGTYDSTRPLVWSFANNTMSSDSNWTVASLIANGAINASTLRSSGTIMAAGGFQIG